jgi:hypothetical protein
VQHVHVMSLGVFWGVRRRRFFDVGIYLSEQSLGCDRPATETNSMHLVLIWLAEEEIGSLLGSH